MKNDYVFYLVLGIYPCQTGGMEIFYYKLLPKIAEKENVTLITNCHKIHSENYKIIRIPKRIFSIPGTSRFGTLFFTALTLVKQRKKIRIVHVPYTSNAGKWGFVLPLLRKLFGIKYLLHIHGGGMKPWRKWNADRSLFKHADKLLSVSNITKEEYQSRSGREIEVVYPLVPFEQAKKSNEEIRKKHNYSLDDKIILFVGSLKELKAPDVLLEAFIQLSKKFIEEHKLKLIFVGDGPFKNKLIARLKECDLDAYVSFTGKIPYADVAEYYKIADIYVIPSKFEGTPKSLLEAMYNKLPIIGSNTNGINNIIQHEKNGLLFKMANVHSLSKYIKIMVNNRKLAENLSLQSYKNYIDAFSFEKTENQLLYIYNS